MCVCVCEYGGVREGARRSAGNPQLFPPPLIPSDPFSSPLIPLQASRERELQLQEVVEQLRAVELRSQEERSPGQAGAGRDAW